MITLEINGEVVQTDVEDDMPLLWFLREIKKLTGVKFGCGSAHCGVCTVHVNGVARRSCVTPIKDVAGQKITTIEGLSQNGALHPVQQAWIDERVPQCGYCQCGQIMTACALLKANKNPSDDDIDLAMSGNLCRCGTYPRIRRAIHAAAVKLRSK